MKYILVTGGVISGVGKGVLASSLGAILKACGLRVTAIKIDPYINIDAGTFSPYEHGKRSLEIEIMLFRPSCMGGEMWQPLRNGFCQVHWRSDDFVITLPKKNRDFQRSEVQKFGWVLFNMTKRE